MQAPGIPANESERLSVLLRYGVSDPTRDSVLDAITSLLANRFRMPFALISLVEAREQRFLSRVGLDADRLPRDLSFCGHVVESGQWLVVKDAQVDPRFFDNPLVTGDPRIRFYAGVPLRAPSGVVLGALCVADHVIRDLPDGDFELLTVLADHVVNHFELGLSRRQEHHRQQELAHLLGHLPDLNNPLSTVISNLDFGIEELTALTQGPGSHRLTALRDALAEARSGAEQVRRSLPAFSQREEPAAERGSDTTPRTGVRRGRVLVVDDEPLVVRSIVRLLEHQHDVRGVVDSREALRLLEDGEPFDAVVCDLTMPHLDGEELFAAVRRVRPDLDRRFVFVTGGMRLDGIVSGVAPEGGATPEILPKPLDTQRLRRVVSRIVGV